MKRKGFTLIELLAVIVILAIIALIATPIILGIVEDARKDSFMRSVELVIKTTDIDIFGKEYNDKYTYTIIDGNIPNLEVGVKNTDEMNGSITYDTNGNDTYAIHNGKYCVIKTEDMNKAEIKDYVEGECEIIIPTDESYFTYEEMEMSEYVIADKEKCKSFFVNESEKTDEEAVSICNNEDHSWFVHNSYPLLTYLKYNASSEEIEYIKENGGIEEIKFSGMAVTGYSSEGPKDIVIPNMLAGKKVIIIGEDAFRAQSLTSVVIPETVVYLADGAFSVNELKSINLKNVEYIGQSALGSNPLTEIILKNGNSLRVVEDDAFYCTELQETSPSYQTIYEINSKAIRCYSL